MFKGKKMIVYDNYSFNSSREIDANGFLRVSMSNISKAQIRPYLGREIPGFRDFNLDPNKVYNVLCPADELEKAAHTFNNLPLTREHIEVDVDDVPKEKIVGSLGDHAKVEGGYLKNNLIIYDKNDIDKVLSGKKKELSCGYRYTPVQESGEYEGQHYDFKMTDIIGNHVALVKQGRAGRDVMVADTSKGLIETIKEKIMAVFDKDLVGDEFVESEHPRANNGQFTSKAGGGESGSKGRNGFSKTQGGDYEKDYGNGWYVSVEKKDANEGESEKFYLEATIWDPDGNREKKDYHYSDFDSTFRKINEYVEGKTNGGSEKKDVSIGERVSGLKDSLKSQLAKEISTNPKKLRELADNTEQLTKLAEVTNMGQGHLKNALNEMAEELDGEGAEKKEQRGDLGSGSPRHIYGQKKDGSIAVALKTTNYPNWNKQEIVKEFDNEEDALNYAEERGEAVKSDYQNRTRNSEKYGIATWVTPKELEHIKKHGRFPDDEETTNDEIPEKAGKPEKAGEENALQQGEKKMAEEVKEEVKTEKKVETTPAEEKPVEDACSKDAEIKEEKKSEEEVVEDKDEKDLKGKEKKAFAEGVDFGEKKEKEEPKKLDSEHESEGTKKADEDKKEEKKDMAKDSALVMDADALRAEGRAEAMADYKAREVARKAVRSIVGDVDVFAFDSADEIYKFACKEAGMNLDEIASYKDAFIGLQAGKAKLAMDASPVSGSNEECLKDIRLG